MNDQNMIRGQNMNIGIDIDWVLTKNFFRRLYMDLYLRNKTTSDFYTFWKNEHHLLPKLEKDFYNKTSIYYGVDDIDINTRKNLWKLAESHQLFYITARPLEIQADTIIWFSKQDIPYKDDIYFSTTKKVLEVQINNIDLFVDDNASILEAIAPYCQVLLVEAPWNEDYTNFKKIRGLEDVYDYLW